MPGDYVAFYDCNEDLFGSATINANCGCIGGNTGLNACPPEVKVDSIKKYYPCFVKNILNVLLTNSTYKKLLNPFQSIQLPNGAFVNLQGMPNLTFKSDTLTYGKNNAYYLGHTGQGGPNTSGWSSDITINSRAIENASALFVQVATLHESGHAYANYYIKTGSYGYPVNTATYPTWAMNIVNFEAVASSSLSGGNFNDHSLFLENYIDSFIAILKEVNGTAYTTKEYQMAALYGMNNPGEPAAGSLVNGFNVYNIYKNMLNKSYENLLTKFNLTPSEINNFNLNNLTNVPASKKTPTTCP